jgi:hypothetical protein
MTQSFFGHNRLKTVPGPPYSPDVGPTDLYLFGRVKGALIWREILDETNLIEAVIRILNGISGAELQCVFRNWIEGIERVIGA